MDIFSAAEKNVYSFIYPLESIIRIPGLHYYRLYREVRHPARHPIKAAVLSFNVIASHQNKLDSVEILKITTFTRMERNTVRISRQRVLYEDRESGKIKAKPFVRIPISIHFCSVRLRNAAVVWLG